MPLSPRTKEEYQKEIRERFSLAYFTKSLVANKYSLDLGTEFLVSANKAILKKKFVEIQSMLQHFTAAEVCAIDKEVALCYDKERRWAGVLTLEEVGYDKLLARDRLLESNATDTVSRETPTLQPLSPRRYPSVFAAPTLLPSSSNDSLNSTLRSTSESSDISSIRSTIK